MVEVVLDPGSQLRIPGASKSSDPIGIYFREFAPGISLGYETETYNYIFFGPGQNLVFIGETPWLSYFNLTSGLNFNRLAQWTFEVNQQLKYWDGVEFTLHHGPHTLFSLVRLGSFSKSNQPMMFMRNVWAKSTARHIRCAWE